VREKAKAGDSSGGQRLQVLAQKNSATSKPYPLNGALGYTKTCKEVCKIGAICMCEF